MVQQMRWICIINLFFQAALIVGTDTKVKKAFERCMYLPYVVLHCLVLHGIAIIMILSDWCDTSAP